MTALVQQECPLCGSDRCTTVKVFDDGVIVGRCSGCGLLYTPRRHSDPTQLFAGLTIEQMRAQYRSIVADGAPFYRATLFEHYLAAIEKHAPGRRLLDVGCAQGFFPTLAMTRGWHAVAVEPNDTMASFASTVLGVDVRTGTLDSAELGDVVADAVTFTDSLEYIPNPRDALRSVHDLLVPGGIVLIKVPNGRYFEARHRLGRRPRLRLGGAEPFSPSLRVVHYCARTLTQLVTACGFDVVSVDACPPIHSPVRHSDTGVETMSTASWHIAPHHRIIRAALHAAGRIEQTLTGRNHLGQAILLVARKP